MTGTCRENEVLPQTSISPSAGDGLATAVRPWPTPTSSDSTSGPSYGPSPNRQGSPKLSETQRGDPLNPAWVECLTGFPVGWTDLPGDGPEDEGRSRTRGSPRERPPMSPGGQTDCGRSETPSSRSADSRSESRYDVALASDEEETMKKKMVTTEEIVECVKRGSRTSAGIVKTLSADARAVDRALQRARRARLIEYRDRQWWVIKG